MVTYRNIYRCVYKQVFCQLSETRINDIPVAMKFPVPNSWIIFHSPINETGILYRKRLNIILRQRLCKMSLEPLVARK